MSAKELLINAIESNRIIDLLEGKNHLEIGYSSHFSNLAFPTDWIAIIEDGIYPLYREQSYDIKALFEGSIFSMLNGKAFDIYCAIGILYTQLKEEQQGRSPFSVNRDLLVEEARKTLIRNKEELKKCYEWQGRHEKEGMWRYIEKMNQGYKTYFNIEII